MVELASSAKTTRGAIASHGRDPKGDAEHDIARHTMARGWPASLRTRLTHLPSAAGLRQP